MRPGDVLSLGDRVIAYDGGTKMDLRLIKGARIHVLILSGDPKGAMTREEVQALADKAKAKRLTPEQKAMIVRALQAHDCGDDLARARASFRGLTPQGMAKQFGQSGRTCQEILDGYQRHHDEVTACIAAVEGL